jgi:hypothetical protein
LPGDSLIEHRLNRALERLYEDPDAALSFEPSVTDRLARFRFGHADEPFEAFLNELIADIEEHVDRGEQ